VKLGKKEHGGNVTLSDAALACEAMFVGYGPLPVVRDVNLSVEAGEIVGLLGANGAGKTTTLLALAGELSLQSGVVSMNGASMVSSLYERARKGLALITEERSVFMNLTCRENLRLGLGPLERSLSIMPELEPLLNKKAGLLSGGEQQMLTLARALAAEPKVLLADEMSLGLAPLMVERLITSVEEAASSGVAVLLVDQHAKRLLRLCDRAYVMRRGEVVIEGTGSELLDRLPEIELSYLSMSQLS
jgi:branched-chain amino acid transport system ATP-binding protein